MGHSKIMVDAWLVVWIMVLLPAVILPDTDVVNSALNKPAIQSSTFRDDQELFGSRLGNDESPHTCAKTQWSWTLFWRVDLKEMLPVVGANLTLRWEYFGSNNKFLYRIDLQVGEENVPFTDTCGSQTLLLDRPDDYNLELVCANTTTGRFITVSVAPNYAGKVTTGSPQLTLCDVKVFTLLNDNVTDGQSADKNSQIDGAHSHNTEVRVMEDDARGNLDQDGLLFLTEKSETNASSSEQSYFNSPRKRFFRERTTKTRLQKLLKQMQTPFSGVSTKPRREPTDERREPTDERREPTDERRETMSDDDFDSLPPSDGRLSHSTDEMPAEFVVWKDEIIGKIQAMHGYVVFSGIAVGILLLLALALGFLILWSLTCKSSETDTPTQTPIHEFSFKAPSPAPPLHTMDRTDFLRIKEFPRDSVPKSRGIF